MKAIVQDVYGSVEVLELRDVEAPVPADDGTEPGPGGLQQRRHDRLRTPR